MIRFCIIARYYYCYYLNKLAQQKLVSELNSLPLRNDTLKLRTTKTEMEKKLVELEEAIKIFSKPKVFVKVDA